MNKWFSETFLPSLFAKTTPNTPVYLTDRQAEMCERYMKAEQHKTDYCFQTVLECKWNGRRVSMCYRGKYRILYFGNTEEEKLKFIEESREREVARKIERFQRHPERIQGEIEKVKSTIASLFDDEDYYEDDSEYEKQLKSYLEKLLQIA